MRAWRDARDSSVEALKLAENYALRKFAAYAVRNPLAAKAERLLEQERHLESGLGMMAQDLTIMGALLRAKKDSLARQISAINSGDEIGVLEEMVL